MTTHERSLQIIAATLPKCKDRAPDVAAAMILGALADKRIQPVTVAGSPEMLKRWHAHCRWLAAEVGDTYEDLYTRAIQYAVDRGTWPIKVIAKTIKIDAVEVTVDVAVPQSTTKATNKQLTCAYEYIELVAAEHHKVLPEHGEWEVG